MTVKQLIEILETFDEESVVIVDGTELGEYIKVKTIRNIDLDSAVQTRYPDYFMPAGDLKGKNDCVLIR